MRLPTTGPVEHSKTWVEYDGISNHYKHLDRNANFEQFLLAGWRQDLGSELDLRVVAVTWAWSNSAGRAGKQVDWRRMIELPRLYAILDAVFFLNNRALLAAAEELALAGVTLIQYRNKSGNAREMLEQARELRRQSRAGVPAPHNLKLIMNDRADLSLAADFDGVHVGQDDLSPECVRAIIGPERWLGVSTHNPEQLREADLASADYLAIGPVFSTSSKERPDPVVGLEGVRRARALTGKPLVAIGGITRANAASVIEAGADSVAVISELLREPGKSAEEFFRVLR